MISEYKQMWQQSCLRLKKISRLRYIVVTVMWEIRDIIRGPLATLISSLKKIGEIVE
jgi:hypothetical protein